MSGAPATTWPDVITTLISGTDLTSGEAAWAMDQIMSGESSPVQIAGFLVALRAKGEKVEEMSGLVEALLDHAIRFEVPGTAVDIVGTGGDRLNTVNISTMASLVVAAAGVQVVKHGNRASSSSTGSADVLERLGVILNLPADRVVQVADEAGITFCFANVFHPAMKHTAEARKHLAVATVFNFLGPLINPAQPQASAIGVADPRMAAVMAGVLAARGRHALVFRGDDGLDELSVCAPSTIWRVNDGTVEEVRITPEDVGLTRATLADLTGGAPEHNAEVVRQVLSGATGPIRDAVLLNAAAAMVAFDDAEGRRSPDLVAALRDGIARGAAAIDDGRAAAVLERWVQATQQS